MFRNSGTIIVLVLSLVCSVACQKEDKSKRIEDVCSLMTDDGFKEYCYASFDTDNNGKVSSDEAAAVTYMSVIGESVKSLDGIEYFTGLTKLFCRDTQVTSLDVSGNKQLVELQCPQNKLTRLYVGDNTQLTSLECGNNQLKFLDVSKNAQLQSPYCSGNQLSSLDLSKNTQLKHLGCKKNALTTLDLSNNTQIETINCADNKFASLDVSMTKWFLMESQSYSLDNVNQHSPTFQLFVNQAQKQRIDDWKADTGIVYNFEILLK